MMRFDFLQQFSARMKAVGIHSLLVKNSAQKTTWKQYGMETFDEQLNVIYAVLLYIMEQSLREETCTMEDIAGFLDELNMTYLKKGLTYGQCRELSDFIINVVLCDEGRAMYFMGLNFETGQYEKLHVSYVANKIAYLTDDVRRTSYYLTEDGYNLLLSTLEIEGNMKLTIQEMIFKLHLEKATYDKAADDIKTIFNMLRIQFQKIQEAMRRIRHNALRYAVTDYEALMEENLMAIEDTRKRFAAYRKRVSELVQDLTEQNIHIKRLEPMDRSNLAHLEVIETYLSRALDEHQRILTSHFDMKALYAKELESLSQMAMIQRFDLRNELDEPLLNDVRLLDRMEIFLRPLFNQEPDKSYNLNLALQKQQPLRKQQVEEEELLSFDEQAWQEQQIEEKQRRLQAYYGCLEQLLLQAVAGGGQAVFSQMLTTYPEPESLRVLLPTVEIFQEVVIELLRSQIIDLEPLRRERQAVLNEEMLEFQVNRMVLDLFDAHPSWQRYSGVFVQRLPQQQAVQIEGVPSDRGSVKRIRCSDFMVQLYQTGEML